MFVLRVAWRYLLAKSQKTVVNRINLLAIILMALVSMSLFVILSAFEGLRDFGLSLNNFFYSQYTIHPVQGKYLRINSSILDEIENSPFIDKLTVEVEEKVFLNYDQKNQVAYIKGIASDYAQLIAVDSIMVLGKWPLQNDNQVILGYNLATSLGTGFNSDNPELRIMVPSTPTRLEFVPRGFMSKLVEVVGLYQISQDLDSRYIITSLSTARSLLGLDSQTYSKVLLKVSPGTSKNQLEIDLNSIVNFPFVIKSKSEQNPALYKMLNNENIAIYFIFTLIMIIAIFNVVGSLIMMILDKKEQTRILLVMGVSPFQMRKIYFSLGIMICLAGAVIGVFFGVIITLIQYYSPFLTVPGTALYYPVKFTFNNLFTVLLIVLILGTISSYWATLGVAKGLRNTR